MCGFVGLTGTETVAPALCMALQAIQHRGQDAAGLGTMDEGRLHLRKDTGMVSTALPPEVVAQIPGRSGIAHVRYPTAGKENTREDAQPFMTRRPGILMAHNGNLTNMEELEKHLLSKGIHMLSDCDSEPILLLLAEELTAIRPAHHTEGDVLVALRSVMKLLKGSYSVAAVLDLDGKETLLAFRDPHGIRPAVYGTNSKGNWIVASESVALDVLDFQRVGWVPPGGMVLLRQGEEPIVHEVMARPARHCVFEHIYFARPDSVMEHGRVNTQRARFGERLADEWKAKGFEADVVVAVPDTSRPAATAMAERLGVPCREGFIKNRYSGRTFIMPDQKTRDAAMRLKLNPIDEVFRDKHVVLVDDSIVRGTTMRRIASMVWRHQPKSLHLAIFSPPVAHPCFYGIDMPSKDELVASQIPPESLEAQLAERFGVNSVTYLTVDGLHEVGGTDVCDACFTGKYVVPISDNERNWILGQRRD